jgi:hypothetical protein
MGQPSKLRIERLRIDTQQNKIGITLSREFQPIKGDTYQNDGPLHFWHEKEKRWLIN